ncbi:MAG: response regulator transcription factor [Oscillospiraceae bacterium]|nr:response regulator transcription factor [Oscillospiraceae bacterium]
MSALIYIVEDDENIREMIAMALTSFAYNVKAFDNAEDAITATQETIPDLFIFDVMLPGMSGIDATQTLRNTPQTQDVPILLLTAKSTEFDKVTGFNYGADDYVTKPFGVMELGARIRALLRRSSKALSTVTTTTVAGDLQLNHSTREVTQKNMTLTLTYKEYELLAMLVRLRDRIVPREELLNAIWGDDFFGESRTLDIHIRTLRQKLGDDADNPRYIKTHRSVGYRFIGE